MKIGCFTLPYRKFPFERALEGIARAGFRYTGVWTEHEEKPLFAFAQGQEPRVAAARRSIEAAGLRATVLFGQHAPLNDEQLAEFQIKIATAGALGCDELLCWGPWPWKEFLKERRPEAEWKRDAEAFFRYLPQAARHAERAGVTLAFKPHSGLTATSRELLEIVRRAESPRVRVSYDGGNVSFYEGLDPAVDIQSVAAVCSSLIVKDHVGGQGVRGPVSFPNVGEGKVDHKAMLRTLHAHGFKGPVSVEKLAGDDLATLDSSARKSREVLEGYVREISGGEKGVSA